MHIACWNGDAESTATIILAHEHNEPLDEIVFVEPMFDANTSAIPDAHVDFIKNIGTPVFRSWNYVVTLLRAERTFLDCFFKICSRGENKGKYRGFLHPKYCRLNREVKFPTIKAYAKTKDSNAVLYLGITTEDTSRARIIDKQNYDSLLIKYGITTIAAERICAEHDLLSPQYRITKEPFCLFCPRARKKDMRNLRDKHPDLFEKLCNLETEENVVTNVWDPARNRSLLKIRDEFFADDSILFSNLVGD